MALPMKLLLAVDGSRYTRRMLTYIVSNELLFRPQYDYVLLHVVPDNAAPSAADPVLEDTGNFLRSQGFEPRRLARRGAPADLLVKVAGELQSNMIIMGCRGQSSLKSMVIGSVTAEVLGRSHVPVLVIR